MELHGKLDIDLFRTPRDLQNNITKWGENMASEEEAKRLPSVSSSSIGLEALFPAGTGEQVCGDGNPELVCLRESLQDWLSPYEPVLVWVQRLLVWERPLYSVAVAVTLNTLFW